MRLENRAEGPSRDDFSEHLSALAAGMGRPAGPEDPVQSVTRRLDDLVARLDRLRAPAAAARAAPQARTEAPAERAGPDVGSAAPPPRRRAARDLPPDDPLAVALAQIRRRQTELDEGDRSEPAPGPAAVLAPSSPPAGESGDAKALDRLSEEIAELRRAIGANSVETLAYSLESGTAAVMRQLDDLKRHLGDPSLLVACAERLVHLEAALQSAPHLEQIAAVESQMRALAEALEQIALDRRGEERVRRLEDELGLIKEMVGRLDPTGAVRDLHNGILLVGEKVGQLYRNAPTAGELENLAERLEEVRRLAALPEIHAALPAIQGALADIAARLDGIEHGGRQAGSTETVLARLDALAQKLDAVGDTPLRAFDVLAGIDERLAEIGARIEALGDRTASAEALDRLAARLDGPERSADADGRLARIEQAIAELGQTIESEELARADAEIARLRAELAQLGHLRADTAGREAGIAAIEAGLRSLAERLDAFDPGDRAVLTHIEHQVAKAARRIEATHARVETLTGLEAALVDLRRFLDAQRDEAIEAAREAARDIVGTLADGRVEADETIVASLQEDVRRLREIAHLSETQTVETLTGVQDALEVLVERIVQLERQEPQAEQPPAPAPGVPPARDLADMPAAPPRGAPATVELSPAAPAKASGETAEDSRPLEPGAARPMRAPIALAARSADAGGAVDDPATRKADIIAAARRAAQAAAVAIAEETEAARQTGAGSKFRAHWTTFAERVMRRRRPILMAGAGLAVALVVAAAAWRVLGSKGAEATVTPAVTAEAPAALPLPVAAPTPQPSDPAAPASETQSTDKSPPEAPRLAAAPAPAPAPAAPEPAPAPAVPAEAVVPPPERIGPAALRAAAMAGDAKAQFEIGARYTDGRGVPRDLAEAAKWYERAALSGLAPAQYRLGSLYEKGQGVAKDAAKARLWYERAAEAGNIKAMHNLGVMLAQSGKQADLVPAMRWFERASEFGLRDSQYNLGVIYAKGYGVAQDLAAAYKWFAIAAREGDAEAAKKRDEIAAGLDKAGLANARLAAQTWTPKQPRPEANEVAGAWEDEPARSAQASPETIQKVQSLLARRGLLAAAAADGQLSPKTREAIRVFQRKVGLPATGEIDAKLLEALGAKSI